MNAAVIAWGAAGAWLSVCYLHVAVVLASFGSLPDKQTLPPLLHAWNTLAGIGLVALFVGLWPVMLATGVILGLSLFAPYRQYQSGASGVLAAAFVCLAVMMMDPGGWLAWLMD